MSSSQNRLHSHYGTNPLNQILGSVENVRPYGNGYRADCPCGHRTSGSLSIGETSDGSVLLNCFAGCSALEVLHSVGLKFEDLYVRRDPKTMSQGQRLEYREKGMRSAWKKALFALPLEVRVVEIAAVQLASNIPLDEPDILRVQLAGERIRTAKEMLCER